jgi:hypothetical protein
MTVEAKAKAKNKGWLSPHFAARILTSHEDLYAIHEEILETRAGNPSGSSHLRDGNERLPVRS